MNEEKKEQERWARGIRQPKFYQPRNRIYGLKRNPTALNIQNFTAKFIINPHWRREVERTPTGIKKRLMEENDNRCMLTGRSGELEAHHNASRKTGLHKGNLMLLEKNKMHRSLMHKKRLPWSWRPEMGEKY